MSDTTIDLVFNALLYRCEVDDLGITRYYDNDGRLHRDSGPAVIHPDGTHSWYRHGVRHRDDGPAVTWADGGEYWISNGKLQRLDGPAITRADGVARWYRDGVPTDVVRVLAGLPDIKVLPAEECNNG
jgi:hypothetical protein